jgi:hypothetical protein
MRIRAVIVFLCIAGIAEAAGMKVRAEPDPSVNFTAIRTWAWDTDAGDVMMARTPTDDPAALKQRIDPLIRKYVEAEMRKKGLTPATAAPDVQLHYYVLISIGDSSQTMGQFLPTVPYWGLPAFNPATSALEVVTKGSLVLDALLPAVSGDRKVVWRGIAESNLEFADTEKTRTARVQSAAAGLVKYFGLRKKK